MALTTALLIIYFTEIVIYSFHLSVLILMICQRKAAFKGPFLNIFRTLLIADLISYITIIITQKLRLIPSLTAFFSTSVYFVAVAFDVSTYVGLSQFFGHLFLAFNRFTTIWFPFKQENIWNRQWYTFIIIFLPFLCVCWRLYVHFIYIYDSDGSFHVIYADSNIGEINYLLTTIIYSMTTCLAGIFNFLAFLKFILRKQNSGISHVNERNLLFVSFVIFITQLLRISYNLGNLIYGSDPKILSLLISNLPYLNDIFAWSESISLMVLSSSTRKAYLSFYFCKPKNPIITSKSTIPKTMLKSSNLPSIK